MESSGFFRSGAFKILVFLAGTVVLSAALAPPLYWGGKLVVARGWLEGGFLDGLNGSLDRAQFSRYFNRAVLLAALLLIWPVLRWMKRGGKGKGLSEFLGLAPDPQRWLHLAGGFLLAAVPLLLLGWFYTARGWYVAKEETDPVFEILLSALGTALAVSFLEEFVFRGALHSLLAQVLRPMALFVTIALVFTVLHFFNAPRTLEVGEVRAGTGFWFVGRIFAHFFSQFGDPAFLAAEFAVLLAVGLVLGYARMKTGALWLGIGLHAGWVFGVKTLSPLAQRAFARDELMPWLGDNLRVGAVSCFVVLLTGAAVWGWIRRIPREPFAGR